MIVVWNCWECQHVHTGETDSEETARKMKLLCVNCGKDNSETAATRSFVWSEAHNRLVMQ